MLFQFLQVLLRKEVWLKRLIYIFSDLKEDREEYILQQYINTEDIILSTYILPTMLCYNYIIIDKTLTIPSFGLFYEINPQL